jgi:hypothetical protein
MSKKKEKGKKKRDLDKYPALNQRLNAKTRFEVLDMDYLKKLNDAELKYLNQFMGEYVSGAFKKTEDGDYSDDNFHKTTEERRECYTRNNTRNRCGLTVSNATGMTYRCDDINSFMDSLTDVDSMVDGVNAFSNELQDEYDGDYSLLEEEMMREMMEDYSRCLNPKNTSDKKLAESNYGKMLLSKFKNVKLIEES